MSLSPVRKMFTNLSLPMLKYKVYFSSPRARLKSCVENSPEQQPVRKKLGDWKKNNKIPKVSTDSWLYILQQPQNLEGTSKDHLVQLFMGQGASMRLRPCPVMSWKPLVNKELPPSNHEPTPSCFAQAIARGGDICSYITWTKSSTSWSHTCGAHTTRAAARRWQEGCQTAEPGSSLLPKNKWVFSGKAAARNAIQHL